MGLTLKRVFVATLAALCLGWSLAAPAAALPDIPIPGPVKDFFIPDCRKAPEPEAPALAWGQTIDPHAASGVSSSTYDQTGYAGFRYRTDDLGCNPIDDQRVNASADTMLGNAMLGVATSIVATSNRLHSIITDPTVLMGPIDGALDRLTQAMTDALFHPWIGVTGTLLAAWVGFLAARGALPEAAGNIVVIIMVFALSIFVVDTPEKTAQGIDDLVIGAQEQISASTIGHDNAENGRAALTVEHILKDGWLRGQLGTADPAIIGDWGDRLWDASTLTEGENPEHEKQAWIKTIDEMKKERPDLYVNATGRGGNRSLAGFSTLILSIFSNGFTILVDAMTLIGFLLFRFILVAAAALAAFLLLPTCRQTGADLLTLVGGIVVNTILLGAASAAHVVLVTAIYDETGWMGEIDSLGWVIQAGMVIAITIALMWFCWPLMDFRRIGGGKRIGLDTWRRHRERKMLSKVFGKSTGRLNKKNNQGKPQYFTEPPGVDPAKGGKQRPSWGNPTRKSTRRRAENVLGGGKPRSVVPYRVHFAESGESSGTSKRAGDSVSVVPLTPRQRRQNVSLAKWQQAARSERIRRGGRFVVRTDGHATLEKEELFVPKPVPTSEAAPRGSYQGRNSGKVMIWDPRTKKMIEVKEKR